MTLVLEDITVIDWTQNAAGPFCTQLLGDLGANVIKIERPGFGDDAREWRPPTWDGESSTFLALNRNKKSICINADDPRGQEIIKKLVEKADVFIHSLKPGSAEARGLGYEELAAINPSLIYCSISAFGESGPLRSHPGYDAILQAYSGIMSVTGNPGETPVRVGVSMNDQGTAMWAFAGILSAVIKRLKTGKGCRVGASLLETGLSWMTVHLSGYMASGKVPSKSGSAFPMIAPYEVFRTKDGMAMIAAPNERIFRSLCDALNMKELVNDPRFAANKDRVENRQALHDVIEAYTLEMDTASLSAMLHKANVPCGPIHTTDQVLKDEQVHSLEMIKPIEGFRIPDFKIIDLPFRLDNQRGTFRLPPPLLGEHTVEILDETGYTPEEIKELKNSGVIGD